jgi:hypothetical protein
VLIAKKFGLEQKGIRDSGRGLPGNAGKDMTTQIGWRSFFFKPTGGSTGIPGYPTDIYTFIILD